MSSLALLFPGQGSQSVGMLADVREEFASIGETFEEASTALGYDLWQLTQDEDATQLNQTQYTQPALLTASVALWRILTQDASINPKYFAGHSLGEYSALVSAGAMRFTDAVTLVSLRGQFMQEAVPQGVGAMAAIIGLDNAMIATLCVQAAQDQVVTPANFNAIGQTVVAGHSDAVDRLVELARAVGAKIAKRIPVSVPSHCALMHPAAERLSDAMQDMSIVEAKTPIVQNVDAKPHTAPDALSSNLIAQLEQSVHWVESIQFMTQDQVDTFIECGPGNVLSGLNRRIDRAITTLNVGTLAGITSYLENA